MPGATASGRSPCSSSPSAMRRRRSHSSRRGTPRRRSCRRYTRRRAASPSSPSASEPDGPMAVDVDAIAARRGARRWRCGRPSPRSPAPGRGRSVAAERAPWAPSLPAARRDGSGVRRRAGQRRARRVRPRAVAGRPRRGVLRLVGPRPAGARTPHGPRPHPPAARPRLPRTARPARRTSHPATTSASRSTARARSVRCSTRTRSARSAVAPSPGSTRCCATPDRSRAAAVSCCSYFGESEPRAVRRMRRLPRPPPSRRRHAGGRAGAPPPPRARRRAATTAAAWLAGEALPTHRVDGLADWLVHEGYLPSPTRSPARSRSPRKASGSSLKDYRTSVTDCEVSNVSPMARTTYIPTGSAAASNAMRCVVPAETEPS